MNDQQKEQNIINLLESQKGIKPSEALLHATLNKMPRHAGVKSPYFSRLQKFSIAAVAVVVIATGGVFYSHIHSAQQSSAIDNTTISSGTSDMALQQDMDAVDTQMAGLSSDTASADQALNAPVHNPID